MKPSVTAVLFALAIATPAGFTDGSTGQQARPTPAAREWKAADVLPLSCVQAWVVAGRSEKVFVELLLVLGSVSLENRRLTLPDLHEVGDEAGRGIAADCAADPDALLFSVVDRQVRRLGKPSPSK
ncbi:hypothetical protein TBR22_A42320 [Luteitalea sp. TBR-22]|uniref:hypothetical protein n=1 Tax=Luteitalea sp. TBR-22 TaxID=2802971 RepID=UPI001AF12961|nr:hypothetical protein [Luteitalea sp. TBR-22]BCS35006.1 hypothetical protein TBR22_A42320 [Luteitalea sp. TBR-22]